MYANMAKTWFSLPSLSLIVGAFFDSLSQKYNLLYALPSYFTFLITGPDRNAFIVTNFVIFFIAHELGIAFVLKRAFKIRDIDALLWSFALCWAVPMMWYPLLEGYPDNGASALLTFAIARMIGEEKIPTKQMAITGALFGLAVVFRRHFAYPVLSTVLVFGLYDLARHRAALLQKRTTILLDLIKKYAALGLGLLGAMLVLEPRYFYEMATTDYRSLYISYERSPGYFVAFAVSRFGLFLTVLALVGYGSLAAEKGKKNHRALIVAALGLAWMALWALGPAQAGEHYLISLAPVCLVVGIYAAFQALEKAGKGWRAQALLAVALFCNSSWALFLSPFILPTVDPAPRIESRPRPPWIRTDYDEIVSLAKYLGDTTSPLDKIVVGGSSFIFNQDLVRAAYTDALKNIPPALRYLQAPESDGEQEPALSEYAMGTVFAVAVPDQYHLGEEKQKVVAGLLHQFPPAGLAADLFKKDERTFALADGVRVEIWRRKKDWPPAILHQQLEKMRGVMNPPRRWITTQSSGRVAFARTGKGDVYLVNHARRLGYSGLFFDQPVTNGHYRVHLELQAAPTCEGLSFSVRAETEDGKSVATSPSSPFQNGDYYIPFTIEGKRGAKSFVTLTMTTTTNSECTVALWQLGLEQMPE